MTNEEYPIPEGYIKNLGVEPDLPEGTLVLILMRCDFSLHHKRSKDDASIPRKVGFWKWGEDLLGTIVAYKIYTGGAT